jgi:molybdopterin molybdotransferase
LTPGIIGLLATNGITEVSVSQLPKVGILTTGDELAQPGEQLEDGQVYESNTVMLESALQQLGIQPVIQRVTDNLNATVTAMSILIEQCDLVLTSGGISVGDHDHIYAAAEKNEIKEVFYKVKQKPGKPLFFGLKDDTLLFGLPGNPASALTCFYVYVSKALEVMTQSPTPIYKRSTLALRKSYLKKGTFTNFLKAQADQDSVLPLRGQSSAMLQTMTDANAIMIVPAAKNECKKGELFEVILID